MEDINIKRIKIRLIEEDLDHSLIPYQFRECESSVMLYNDIPISKEIIDNTYQALLKVYFENKDSEPFIPTEYGSVFHDFSNKKTNKKL